MATCGRPVACRRPRLPWWWPVNANVWPSNPKKEELAQAVMDHVEGQNFGTVASIDKKRRKVNPPVPFNTTSLMAAASSIGITPARTMRLAESLYMDGYISYQRVDNTVYPATLDLAATVQSLEGNPAYASYCKQLLAKGKLTATRGKKETTDHPPIYPTAAATPDDLAPAEFRLYNLIARRFLATLSDPAFIEGTKVTIEVNGEPFAARGDVLAVPGFRAIYPFGLKKDEQLPAMEEGQRIDFAGATLTKKQTEPPARYSQGKLIQEMEKRGLGTKSTRHSIIERLYTVKYVQNNPIEPSALGMAVCDALGTYAPHITSSDMTADLEQQMTAIAEGSEEKTEVVDLSRKLLADQLGALMPHQEEVKDALADAVAADAYVGKCPKCGKDLQLRASQKNHSMFIGCAGWPDCDVTYPLPSGRIEALPDPCPTCGMPQVKVSAFRQKPRTICIDPLCPTNVEPDVVVGTCHACAENGKDAKLIAHKNPRTLKRFIRCENYDECGTGYPLPQYGRIEATGEECPDCGAPFVVVNTQRGPWKLCPNFKCPAKERAAAEKEAKKKAREEKKAAAAAAKASGKSTSKRKTTAKKSGAKKTITKKAAAKKTAKKSTAKKRPPTNKVDGTKNVDGQ
jgi:DNA topoisomerase-1